MEKLSGLVLDVYDDPSGEVLRAIFPRYEQLPELIKSAHVVTPDERAQLPDDLFALVLEDGPVELRKYACVDAGNTALAVEYFMQLRHKLPEEAQKVAAANLAIACGWYGIDPPEELQKVARGVVKKVVEAVKSYGRALSGSGVRKAEAAVEKAKRNARVMGIVADSHTPGDMPNLSAFHIGNKSFRGEGGDEIMKKVRHAADRGAVAVRRHEAIAEKAREGTSKARKVTAAVGATGLGVAAGHHELKKWKEREEAPKEEAKEAGLLSWGAKKAVQNPLGTAMTVATVPGQIKGIGQTAKARGEEAKASGAIINPNVLKATPVPQ